MTTMTIIQTLLGPGILAMRRMRIAVKMSLMGLFLLLPLTLLLVETYRTAQADRAFASAEIEGVHLVRDASTLVGRLQAHRGLTNRALSGDTSAAAALAPVRVEMLRYIKAVDEAVARVSAFDAAGLWQPVREGMVSLAEGRHATQRQEAFAQHSAAIEQLRQLVLQVAERSGLLLDPEAASFFLMDIAVERMLPLSEALGITRGQGAAILVRGEVSNTERVQMLSRMDMLEGRLRDLREKFLALQRAESTPPAGWEKVIETGSAFAVHVRQLFSADVVDGDPSAFFARGSQAIDAFATLNQAVLTDLEAKLESRRAQRTTKMAIELGIAGLGVAAMLYFAASFYISFIGAFRALTKGVKAVAAGNLEYRVEIRGRDELAEVGAALESMNARLSAMVAEIRSSAVRVGQAGQQAAGNSESLSQRTDEQAASLRQTVATVGQLGAAVASNAEAAQELDQVASELRVKAEAGGEAMRTTVGAMADLQGSSKRVGEIIGVIDGIAFQTNILALNAAVEAARAGESGRGFAVVAAEVRQLAQRSGAAAGEIRKLIGQSTEQVGASVERIQGVSATLDAVVTGVQEVSQRLRGIADSTAEQNQGLQELSRSVDNLDGITRQNAAMVDASATASQELVQRAATLSSAVASIRLRQGSADEARDLVERALDTLRLQGFETGSRTIRDPSQGFIDRDLYVFVVDRRGTYRLHAARPAMEGKRVHDVPGIDGDRFVEDAWSRTERDAGWIEYDILNLETGAIQPKASYVRRINDELVVGCGVYRSTGPAAPPAATPRPVASRSHTVALRAAAT
jgi:methyl-accepting chemotaxis protein